MSNQMRNGKIDTKKVAVIGMFIAISFIATILSKMIPPIFSAAPYLTLDFKDAFVVMVGFMYGPSYGLIVAIIEALIEMFTISSTGFIGLIMNVLSTGTFVVIGSLIYYKKRTINGAVIGLLFGGISMIIMMILWNYIITPFYMGVPRDAIISILLPVILPFNAIKALLNSALCLLLYKRIILILSKAELLPKHKINSNNKISIATVIASVAIMAVCVVFIFSI